MFLFGQFAFDTMLVAQCFDFAIPVGLRVVVKHVAVNHKLHFLAFVVRFCRRSEYIVAVDDVEVRIGHIGLAEGFLRSPQVPHVIVAVHVAVVGDLHTGEVETSFIELLENQVQQVDFRPPTVLVAGEPTGLRLAVARFTLDGQRTAFGSEIELEFHSFSLGGG